MKPVAPLTRGEDRCLHWITRADFTGKGVAITEEELAFHLGYKRPYVSALVNGLADKGYMTIEKRRHPGSPFRHNFYRVNVWNPHVRRGICNLRAEFQRVKAKRLREAECASSDSERTATAPRAQTSAVNPSLRASKALPARSREARFEIRRSSMEQRRRHLHVADLTCLHCQEKDAELERLQGVVRKYAESETKRAEEVSGAYDTIRAQGKEITRLRRDITRQANESARAEQIEKVVEHWRYHRPKASSAFGKPGSRSYQVIEKALTLMADDPAGPVLACCEAIDGLHLAPWQRYDRWHTKRIDDKCSLRNGLEYALGDEQRIERCREVLRKVRGGGAARAWRVYMALGETERAWADEVMDLLREQPAPRERFCHVDGIRTRTDA